MRKFFLLLILFLSSCWGPKLDTPEALLQHYVYLSFAGVDAMELEKYFTAEFLQKLEEEQKKAAPDARKITYKNLHLISYKLLNKLCETEKSCQLRFEISYNELNPTDQSVEFSTETKKIAILKLMENNEWKLDEIDHLKTQHEIKKQIDITTEKSQP